MPDDVWPLIRAKARAAGTGAMEWLRVLAEVAEHYQSTPTPCRGCQRPFPRRELSSIDTIPKYAERWTWTFCLECRQRLTRQFEYEGIRRDENRRVTAQLERAISRHLPATLTLQEWLATLDRFNWRCAYCRTGPYEAIEHFVPIELGGGTTADNCVPACTSCNSSKGIRHPKDIGESSRSPAAIARVRAYLALQHAPLPPPAARPPAITDPKE